MFLKLVISLAFLQIMCALLHRKEKNWCLSILHFNDAYEVENSPAFVYEFLKREDQKTIKLFSGDIFNPSTISTIKKGEQFKEFFDRVNLDAAVLGNHEFDFGEDWFSHLKSLNKLDWLAGNLKYKGTSDTIGNAQETKIIKIKNLSIGIFGLVDEDWIDSSGLFLHNFDFEDVKTAGRRLSKVLHDQNCDLIIALTHMLNKSDRILLNDSENHVNLVLGGHDHIYYVELANNRLLLKSGFNFEHFSHIKIYLEDNPFQNLTTNKNDFSYLLNGSSNEHDYNSFKFSLKRKECDKFINVEIDKIIVDQNGEKDLILAQYVDTSISPIINSLSRPIFYLLSELDARRVIVKKQESGIGDFLSDLILISADADISIVSSGTFRLEKVIPENSVFTNLDAIHLLPFTDEIVVFEFSGEEILQMLEHAVDLILSHDTFMLVAGIVLEYDPEKPIMNRIYENSIFIGGQALQKEKIYRVATISYLAKGKFGFKIFSNNLKKSITMPDSTLLSCLKKFWEIAMDVDSISEFKVFKQTFPQTTLIDLIGVRNSPNLKSIYYSLQEDLLEHEDSDYLLEKMSSIAIKRFMYYSLSEGIKKADGLKIFAIDLTKKTDRIIPVTLQDL